LGCLKRTRSREGKQQDNVVGCQIDTGERLKSPERHIKKRVENGSVVNPVPSSWRKKTVLNPKGKGGIGRKNSFKKNRDRTGNGLVEVQ